MMVEMPRRRRPGKKDIDVLWVANLRALKRPELVLELARQLPDVRFMLAGGAMPGGETYYDDVMAAAARLPNVSMLGAVRYADSGALVRSREDLPQHLEPSRVSRTPSCRPGSAGVPVVTFFDPDGLVQRLPLGRVASSVDDMREAIRGLLEIEVDRQLLGRRAREFATREFTNGVAARYLELFDRQAPQPRLSTAQHANEGANLP